MTRRKRREWNRWERRELMRLILEDEERDKKIIEEVTKKLADARAFQEEQVRRGIEPEPITVSTDWHEF